MRKYVMTGMALGALVLSGGRVRAGGCPCSSGASEACAPACPAPVACGCAENKVCLHAEIVPHKTTVETPVVKEFDVKTREEDRAVERCRQVPVCVTDPCTGCTRTEYKSETYVEKVKATVIDVCPTHECTTKKEEKTNYCINITIDHLPACAAPAAPSCQPLGCDH